jgi:hypothetical protein
MYGEFAYAETAFAESAAVVGLLVTGTRTITFTGFAPTVQATSQNFTASPTAGIMVLTGRNITTPFFIGDTKFGSLRFIGQVPLITGLPLFDETGTGIRIFAVELDLVSG